MKRLQLGSRWADTLLRKLVITTNSWVRLRVSCKKSAKSISNYVSCSLK